MSSHEVFNRVDDPHKARLEGYWQKKLPRLQKLLVPYPADQQEVRLTVSQHQQGPQRLLFEVRVVIHLPTGTLAAEETDKDALAAIDRVVDRIAGQIKRHKELVRHDYLYKRKSRRRADVSASFALLQHDRDRDRREDFFRLLRPQLRLLRDYGQRELEVLERQHLLHRGEVTVDDVLDQVTALAWERFDKRPKHLSLDLWLTDLLHEVLEQLIKQEPRPHASLQQKAENVPPQVVPQPDEQEWWADLFGEVERLRLEDLIPDPKVSDAWDELETREQRERLLSLLSELPTQQRQTFLLYALEDYNTAEIAMLQDRPENAVKADIEAARQFLRQRLQAEDQDSSRQTADRSAALQTASS